MAKNAPHSHEHHIVSTSTYFFTLIALVVLMLLTVEIAKFNLPDIGPISGTVVNQVVALVIAVIKAGLVVTIFMGVKWSTTLTKLWVAIGFGWLILIFGILGDYTTRHYEMIPSWDGKPDGALPREAPEHRIIPPATSNDLNVKIRQ